MTLKDLYIYGAGGFGREIRMIINQINDQKKTWNVKGFIDDNVNNISNTSNDPVSDSSFLDSIEKEIDIVIAIGDTKTREKIYTSLKKNKQINFPNIIHPSVHLDSHTVQIGSGNMILINTILSNEVSMGDVNLINMGAIIGHDVKIGSFSNVNPGCNIAGGVTIGNHCDIGLGASTVQYITISDHVKIGGNSMVTRDCESHYLYLGIPAKKALPLDKRI